MPSIKPVSDLRNYNEVLRNVSAGRPVFLTKNGRGRFAIIDMDDYEKTQATIALLTELSKGRTSGEEKGWIAARDVEAELGLSLG
ncbi:MAG: type II toxin-antitoxin system prevent-host-death family antitoxin [Clostridiales Family XIII bacterium]|jgi:prevent-host-death family protein|nr:type II toxin-antitoxin system prevent-host-death family antitoxin [Clostridiales Family XIII bacterium]